VGYLFGPVTELRGEVDRESEQEIHWWNHSLISLKPAQGQPPDKARDQRHEVSFPHQDAGGVLKGRSKWK